MNTELKNNAHPIPAEIWAKMPVGNLRYQAAAYLADHSVDEAIKRFSDAAVGSQIPGRSKEAYAVVQALRGMIEG